MPAGEISDIRARVRAFSSALRDAEADELAERIEAYALGFTHVTDVRRAVSGIAQQLAYWRETGDELPDSPPVQIAANQLEDACQAALKRGVIVAAVPSLRAQAKRKFTLAATTLAGGLALLAASIALVALGIDMRDLEPLADAAPVALPRGQERVLPLFAAGRPLQPEAVMGVELLAFGGCDEGGGARGECTRSEPRLWASGRLPTFELRLPNQAYGLQFALSDVAFDGAAVTAKLLVAAADQTPEGRYRIELDGYFLGYAVPCAAWKQPLGLCEPATDPPRHAGLRLPAVVVDVGPPDPAHQRSEAERKQREAEERRQRAEERAERIATVLEGIELELGVTDKMLRRKQFEQARARVDKLGTLFEPLDALAAEQLQDAVLPEGVSDVRAHYDEQRTQLAKFEDRVFDQAFDVLNGPQSAKEPEAKLIHNVARKLRISDAYVEAIYTGRPGDIEARLTAIAEDRREAKQRAERALEARCGALPQGSWKLVSSYLTTRYSRPGERASLGECMTPRLTEAHCWRITCDYRVAYERDRGRKVARMRAGFYVRGGRVTGHGDPN